MNATANNASEIILAGDVTPTRNPPHLLDNQYIKNFIAHPELGKTQALLDAGFTGKNPTQRANELHKRLRHKIDQELACQLHDGILIGLLGLKHLAVNAEQESVKAASCSKLVEYGYRFLPLSDQKQTRTRGEIQKDIEATMARIEQAQVGTVT